MTQVPTGDRYVRMRPRGKGSHRTKRKDWLDPWTGTFRVFKSHAEPGKPGPWYKVPGYVAAVLEGMCEDPYSQSPKLFEVCTEEQARELDEQARLERERAKAIVEPTVDTAEDMTKVPQPETVPGKGRGDIGLDDLERVRGAALAETRTASTLGDSSDDDDETEPDEDADMADPPPRPAPAKAARPRSKSRASSSRSSASSRRKRK